MLEENKRFRLLFHRLTEPGQAKQMVYNMIPLKKILNGSGLSDAYAEYIKDDVRNEVLKTISSIQLTAKIKKMFERTFPITTLHETNATYNFADVVKVYNRINSGGVRVAAEEKAYATLVSIRPDANEWLRKLFTEIHGGDPSQTENSFMRDDVLKRQKEQSFGFKLFIRTLAQVANFHLNQKPGSSSLSFDVFNRADIRDVLSREGVTILEETQEILLYMKTCLEGLCCDDLRFLPDTLSLIPSFELLLKYPAIMEESKYQQLMQYFVLKSLLLNPTQREIFDTVGQIRKTNVLEECAEKIRKRKINVHSLLNSLQGANTLQDRYTLMLYWLERKNNARDFSYKNLTNKSPGEREVLLTKDCKPEKQHIVPYSILKKIYTDMDEEGRITKHPANNIGNITYISQEENSLDGLSDRMVNLGFEEPENLKARLFIDSPEANPESPMHYYNQLFSVSVHSPQQLKTYEKFYLERAKLIAKGFTAWVGNLEPAPSNERIEPRSPLFNQSVNDTIRDLDYDNALEDLLYKISEQRGVYKRKLKEAKLALSIKESNEQFLSLRFLDNEFHLVVDKKRYKAALAQSLFSIVRDPQFKGDCKVIREDKVILPVSGSVDITAKVLSAIFNYLTKSESLPHQNEATQQENGKNFIAGFLMAASQKAQAQAESVDRSNVRKKWNEALFSVQAREQLGNDMAAVLLDMLHKFEEIGFVISWGTGYDAGSYSIKAPDICPRSFLTIYANGNLSLNFGWLNSTNKAEMARDRFVELIKEKTHLEVPPDYVAKYCNYPKEVWSPHADPIVGVMKQVLDEFRG